MLSTMWNKWWNLGFVVAWVEFDEQFSMFSDQTPYALDMVHRIRRPQLQGANNHACGHAVGAIHHHQQPRKGRVRRWE